MPLNRDVGLSGGLTHSLSSQGRSLVLACSRSVPIARLSERTARSLSRRSARLRFALYARGQSVLFIQTKSRVARGPGAGLVASVRELLAGSRPPRSRRSVAIALRPCASARRSACRCVLSRESTVRHRSLRTDRQVVRPKSASTLPWCDASRRWTVFTHSYATESSRRREV